MKNLKSTIKKSLMAAGITFGTLAGMNTKATHQVKAETNASDPKVVSVNYVPKYGIAVWKHANTESKLTGQYLPHASSWKVIDSAYDAKGNKWYDLGKNQWVMEKYIRNGVNSVNPNTRFDYVAPVVAAAPATQAAQQPAVSNNYNTAASSYVSSVGGSEASAKAWIANRESGGSYTATNGQYIGKYQLSSSYLGGDYSAANQERVADNYVKGRYGSWTAAQNFWQNNGWY